MSVQNVSPANFIGGIWEPLKDRFLVGAGGSYAVNEAKGEATHTLTIDEMPSHAHTRGTMEITGEITSRPHNAGLIEYGGTILNASGAFSLKKQGGNNFDNGAAETNIQPKSDITTFTASKSWTGETSFIGRDKPFDTLPPYLAVYMWKRTA